MFVYLLSTGHTLVVGSLTCIRTVSQKYPSISPYLILRDVVVIHQAFKKPPSFENRGTTGVCLGHDTRIAGGVSSGICGQW